MTYRERRLAKAERLREWADKREERSNEDYEASRAATAQIPFGQPILVGHHSERGHRRAIERSDAAMSRSVESSAKATSMRSRADNIEAAADRAIYDDDPDAIERLEDKLARMERRREEMKAANTAYRREHREELKAMSAYDRHCAVPHQSYELQNLGGNISRTRERIARLKRERESVVNGTARARKMAARFKSPCADCGEQIEKGGTIYYVRAERAAYCEACGREKWPAA